MNDRYAGINRLWIFIKKHQQWVGFLVVIIALLYSYISVLFSPRELFLDIIYGVLFVLLISGLVKSFRQEQEEVKKIKFNSLDGLFVIFGVFATYSISHFFGVSVVIGSSVIGLLGHFFARKYEVAIYCGSFAGMVSIVIFGFLEVLVLALTCAFIYILTKPLLKGYGGKLGTIAFMSSLIVHSIFADEFLVVVSSLHFIYLIGTTISGVLVAYCVQHYLKQTPVFASALPSLIFAIIFIYIFPEHIDYVVVFFSASFIGMSSRERLPNLFYVIISGLVLGIIYYIFIHYFNGLGGKLGLVALISVIITSGLSDIFMLHRLE
ncbi:MAG: hypothetical protein KAU02_01855 [Tenericutes bacterium]|nr:hypothetical protein [Mycoplasmatota bacterium]